MYAHSMTGKFISKLASILDSCYQNSIVVAFLERIAAFLVMVFSGSILVRTFWHHDVSLPLWQNSLLYKVFRLLQNLVKKVLAVISVIISRALTKSMSYRVCRYALTHLWLLFIGFGVIALGALYVLPASTAVKLLAAGVGALLVLVNVTWGLFLLIAAFPLMPNEGLLLYATLLGVVFLWRRLRTGKLSLFPLAIEPALVLYLLVAVAATLASITFVGSLRDLAMYVFSFVAFFVLINQIESKKELAVYINVALMGAVLVALYGIYQYIFGAPMQSGWVDSTRNPLIGLRIYSFFGNPNVLAKYLVMMIPFAAAMFFTAKKITAKFIYLAVTGILSVTLLLTLSRGGALGLLVGLFFFGLLKDRRILIVILIVIMIGAAAMPQVFLQRFATIGSPLDSSNAYRYVVWKEAASIISDYPLTGVGLGYQSFQKIYPYYMLDRTKKPFHTHNTYLQVLVETGIFGLLAFLWLLAGVFKRGLKALGRSHDQFLKHIIIASLAAIIGVLVQGVGEVIVYLPKVTMFFWLTVALVFLCIKLENQGRSPVKTE